jgi:PEP-CTERM motif
MMTGFGKMIARTGLFALAMGMASSAQAAQYLITYRGIVASGSDIDGVFGSVRSLVGLAFTAAYTLNDPSTGAFQTNDGVTDFRSGGSAVGRASPIESASLTIAGITQNLGPAFYSVADLVRTNNLGDGVGDDFIGITYPFSSAMRLNGVRLTVGNRDQSRRGGNAQFLSSLSYVNPVNYALNPDMIAGDGDFDFRTNFGNITFTHAIGSLQITSFSIGPVPLTNAVPEPASWAMMIAGFGFVGGALRSKRRTLGQLRAIA